MDLDKARNTTLLLQASGMADGNPGVLYDSATKNS